MTIAVPRPSSAPPPGRSGAGRVPVGVVAHLVARELRIRYRRTRFGLAWGVIQPLLRFAALGFVFGSIARLGIPDYPMFLFTGVLVWTWFAVGLSGATTCILDRPELTGRVGLPRIVIPLVAVLTGMVDMLLAMPILVVAGLWAGLLSWTVVLLPVVLLFEGIFICGIGLLACSSHVYFRDTRPIVETGLMVGFYATPIVYSVEIAPEWAQTLLQANPMARVVEAARDVVMYGTLPALADWAWLVGTSLSFLVAGMLVFRRASPDFLDEL